MAAPGSIEPVELLYEVEPALRGVLPSELVRLYGGDLSLADECLYANFVATLDGVVSIPTMRGSNAFIAGDSDADRFVMGLLRAYAEAVLVGAGVLRASPRGTWRAAHINPPAATGYAELRRRLGAPPEPEIAVLTGRGSIDTTHPLFESGAIVLTSSIAAGRLRARLPSATTVVPLGDDTRIELARVVAALHDRGHRRILSEAGPHTFGALIHARLADELFLTSSPLLVGDAGPGSRLALVEGADLASDAPHARLLSLRRHGSHLFHRYALERRVG
jgi:riboflavin biosynthesis pyrimidine reductase